MNHVTLVVLQGHSHLIHLYKFRGGFKDLKNHLIRHKPLKEVLEDIAWWRNELEKEFIGIPITLPPPPINIHLYVDASESWGIGLWWNGKWLA